MEKINYSFKNGVASLKPESNRPLDEGKLRETIVYAKLMLDKGGKYGEIKSRTDFLTNEANTFIRAEMFILGSKSQIVYEKRVFVNVNIESKIMADPVNKIYYVELEHPSLDVSKSTEATFE